MAETTTMEQTEKKAAPAPAPKANIEKAAWALYIIVFFSGAILMGIEIAGSRILAPSFGTSIFVWGSLIGVFMGAMALGYYFGGKWADKNPSFKVMASLVSVAGVYSFIVFPFLGPTACEAIARSLTHRMLGPLVATTLLFGFPILLLAMVSPFAVKLRATNLAGLGGVAGWLYALSTFGSIVGTLGTAFFLIPFMRVSLVVQFLSFLLVIIALGSYMMFQHALRATSRDDIHGAALMALIALGLLQAGFLFPPQHTVSSRERLLRYAESEYHDIAITESMLDPDGRMYAPESIQRWMKFNENIESGIYPYRSAYLNAVGYTDLLHLPLLWNAKPKKLLVVGSGGAVVPTQYVLHYPSIERVDVLELDAAVQDVAYEFFQVAGGGKIHFDIGDARRNLRDLGDETYDVIVLDAYSSGGQIPFHLMTWEFLKEARDHLNPNGILVSNIITALQNGNLAERPADLYLAEWLTLGTSEKDARGQGETAPLFKQIYIFPKVWPGDKLAGKEEEYRNVILLATNEEQPKSRTQIVDAAKALTAGSDPVVKLDAESFVWHARNLWEHPPTEKELEGHEPLTDQYAPVDTMYRPVKREESMRPLW